MDREELTPQIEELKRVLEGKIDEEKIIEELETYINTYKTTLDAAVRGIIRKYGDPEKTSFVTANAVSKKIGDLRGNEQSVDIVAKVVYTERKDITVRNAPKTIISGILGDDTATASFTIWENVNTIDLEKGSVYVFRNAYSKLWNDKIQINLGARGKVEPSDVRLDLPERTISMDSSEIKIGEIRDGAGNVTVTGRILTAETRNITVKGEGKVVYSGMIADDSGKIQYSAWNDYNLKEGETVRIENAYIRTWKGIPQLNLGDRCEVSRVDDTFGTIDTGCSRKTVGEIVRIGGGLDITVSGTVVDMRQGSGLINRCPQCNRSVLNDECTAHGKVVPVPDLRMKLTVDDGTGALSAIVNRECTTKLTGVTLDSAVQLAKARGDNYVVAKALAEKMMMKRVKISGNVMSDEYGPMMIVRDADFEKVDVIAEATKLLDSVEAAL